MKHEYSQSVPEAVITSRQHPLCKMVRLLHSAKGRRENGLFLVEGANAVGAALRANWPLQCVLVDESDNAAPWCELASRAGVPLQTLGAHLMEYVSEAQTPTQVLALASLPTRREGAGEYSVPDVTAGDSQLVLVLDGIGDPGNVGTLMRSADVAGAGQCVLTPSSADAFGPKAVRASAGSLFHLHIATSTQDELVAALSRSAVPLVTAVAHGGNDCFDFRWPRRCALVLGHETRGVSPDLERAAAHRVTIPNYGRAESLNVAAAGVVMLFAWRQSLRRHSA